MAKPWEKYANPAVGYGADPYKVNDERRKEQAAAIAQQNADRAAAQAAQANENAAKAAAIAEKKLAVELAKDGLMIGPDGQVMKNPNGPVGKAVPNNPQRRAQIESLLDVIARTRTQADDFLAVGEQGRRAREWPIIGATLGQNRADVEGLTKSIEGDLIQQQIALLSAANGGNGVASLANSDNEAKRMAAAIANLDENQSVEEFNAGLDRAEAYYRLQLETFPQAQNQNISANINQGLAAANDGTSVRTGNNGFDKYVTDQDRERTATLQRAYDSGASVEQMNAELSRMNLEPLSPEKAQTLLNARAQGQRVNIAPYATGERGLSQQLLGAVADSSLGAYGGAALNAATLGYSDELVGAAFGDRAGELAQYAKEYARDESPVASFLGDITGGTALGGPLTAGLRYAGLKGAQAASPFAAKMFETAAGSLPRAAVTAATLQGAMTGAGEMNENRLLGAGIGGAAGLGGGYLGGKIFGGIDNVAKSGPATRGGNMVRNLYNGRQVPEMPVIDQPSRMINNSIDGQFGNVLSQMDEAAGFGLPMTLADADPGLRSLAGATARRSPDAMGMAESALIPRQRGQYDRLLGAVDRDLGPIANVPQLSDDLIKKARADSAPLYDAAYSAPGASSVDISGIIKTPIGRQGLERAGSRVQNQLGPDGQPVDPASMGFDFNEAGEVTLGQTPSFQQLDYFKQGLDDIIEGGYDPIARSYTPEAQAATAMKQRLVGQIDNVNPAYKDARAAYAGPAADRDALQQGKAALNLPPDAMNFQRQGLSTSQQGQYGLGYRSAMAEQAGRVRLASNPWETAYGTPQAQAKVGSLFPGGADRFGRQYALEGQMARTNNEITGGSATAGRLIADDNFSPGVVQSMAFDAATSGAPIMTGGRLLGKLAGGELGRVGAKKKADALAPLLFDADPAKNAAVMRELQKNIKVKTKATGIFGGKARRSGSVAGGAGSVGLTLGLSN